MPKILFQKGHKINLGKKHSQAQNLAHGIFMTGNKFRTGKIQSEETKSKIKTATEIRKLKLGYVNSPEARYKISLLHRGKPKSEEHKKKLSIIFQGEKSFLWQGGKSFEPYSTKWTKLLKTQIRERDNYKCGVCENQGRDVHHIDYNKQNCEENNLITLCQSCHRKTNFNRKSWQKLFSNKILVGSL